MLNSILTALLALLGAIGMAAVGSLLAHWPDKGPGIEWPIACVLVALSYMVVYGLTHASRT